MDRLRSLTIARRVLAAHRGFCSSKDRSRGVPLIGRANFYFTASSAKLDQRFQLRTWGIRTESTVTAADAAAETPAASSVPPVVPPSDGPVEVHTYEAEVGRLMDIIVNSLYCHKEVFLRELVSNASDALDKLRFLSQTDASLLESEPELAIKIRMIPDERLLIVQDSGVGMAKEELIHSLGTIAQSGTANFVKALKENQDSSAPDSNLIGKFGVGFYSSFLVADKVAVTTRKVGTDKQHVWEARAHSNDFVVREETNPEYMLPRGTAVILHIKEEDVKEFLDYNRILELVRNYSQFLSFSIYLGRLKTAPAPEATPKEEASKPAQEGESEKVTAQEGEADKSAAPNAEASQPAAGGGAIEKKETREFAYDIVNEIKPIWVRNPKEVTKEEYLAYYKKTYNEHLEPMAYTHFNTEGDVEFKSLLYVPGMSPIGSDAQAADKQQNIRMYVKRVFISDEFNGELFPRYLCFMRGVIDSNDLPLNVSRELLQESKVVATMRKRLVKKTLDLFEAISKRDNKEEYKRFYRNFGKYVKLGVTEDKDNHNRLCKLLRFYSSKHQEEMTTLADYVANMKEGQEAIYFLSSESVKSAKTAPFLEKLNEKDYEVLYLTEPMDEVAVTTLKTYDDKDFVDISKEDFALADDDAELDRLATEYSMLCDWLKDWLGERVAKVEVSNRLVSSPCALVSGKHGWSANMERIYRAQNLGNTPGLKEHVASTRILEINPKHPIIQYLDEARLNERPGIEDTIDLLYDTTLLASGFPPDDPAGLGSRIYGLMNMVGEGPPKVQTQNTA